MKKQLSVIKIGGNVIDDPRALELFLEHFAQLDGGKILVHGGGKAATQLAGRLGIPQSMIEGRRITDEATLKIITMVYAGGINKNIVALLQADGCNAIGLSGADGNLVQAHKRTGTEQDYGFAGDVDAVNDTLLQRLLEAGLTPIIAPVTHDCKGQLLNTNADTIAQEIAQAMSRHYETQLIYCFEKNGVLSDINDEESYIPSISPQNFAALTGDGTVAGGMLPKLQNAFAAISKGVQSVIIGKWDKLQALVSGTSGTKIHNG